MSSKKDYDKQVNRRRRADAAIDKIYGGRTRSAAESKKRATDRVDADTEKAVRGYIKGSMGDPAVRKRLREQRSKK